MGKPDLYMWWATPDACLNQLKNIGGSGGWFDAKEGHNWERYLNEFCKDVHQHLNMLRDDIIKREIWQCGDWHQKNNIECVPVFSDGFHFSGSYRGWGDLMAAVWSSVYNVKYNYMHFYCGDAPQKPVVLTPAVSCGDFTAEQVKNLAEKLKLRSEPVTYECSLSIGLAGCTQTGTIILDADLSPEEIEVEIRDEVLSYVDWGYNVKGN